jgi:hypothetical protein
LRIEACDNCEYAQNPINRLYEVGYWASSKRLVMVWGVSYDLRMVRYGNLVREYDNRLA